MGAVKGGVAGVHAPAFVERWKTNPHQTRFQRVAGVHAPAFVERTTPSPMGVGRCCVAGVHAPAFVERRNSDAGGVSNPSVSPGFTPRPLLSAVLPRLASAEGSSVAGVHAPAFVERPDGTDEIEVVIECRRGSRPGLC